MKRKENFFTPKSIALFIILGAFIVLTGCNAKYSGLFSMESRPPDGLISSSKDGESASEAPVDKTAEDNSDKDDKTNESDVVKTDAHKLSEPKDTDTDDSEEGKKNNLKDREKDQIPGDSEKPFEDKPIGKEDEASNPDKKDNNDGDNRYDDREPALPVAGIITQSSNQETKKVAITFDDGPDDLFTPQILDILKEKDAKATFFVSGNNANVHQDVLKRIHDEGHAIGNHSWSHNNFTKISKDKQIDEIQKTDDLIKEVTGESKNLFRLPYGAYNDTVLKNVADQGFYNIYWSIDPRDWSGVSPKEILANVKENIEPGSIILLHCSGSRKSIPNTVKALPNIIDFLRDQGYEIVTIPKLLDDQLYK